MFLTRIAFLIYSLSLTFFATDFLSPRFRILLGFLLVRLYFSVLKIDGLNKEPKFVDRKKTGFFVAKILIAVMTIVVLIREISVERLLAALSASDKTWLSAGLLLLTLNLYLQFVKWVLLVSQENPAVSRRQILYSLFVGSALGLITPGRLGDLARSAFIRNADWARLTGLLMIDKLISLVVLYFFGILGFAHFISMAMQPLVWLPILLAAVMIVALLLVLIFNTAFLRSLLQQWRQRLHHLRFIDRLVGGIELATPLLCVKLLAYSTLHLLTYCTQFVLFILAFERINWFDALVSAVSVMFAKALLPVSLGDLGVRESASVYFLGQVGVSAAAAFDASFLLFCVNVLAPALAGLVLFLVKRRLNGRSDVA